ncbi:hypothetical protein BDW42DRAFT_42665 [Aspergillus taichungensis]|uniref:Uncharacterized protein n=1 Tax=Aspergillus taichungensis TaxID=482145 RepID=A0A2J5HEE1_9EURO|nr:hypothetical protein BDW42DRAFT_42665 [Aspergillus taichungensis]
MILPFVHLLFPFPHPSPYLFLPSILTLYPYPISLPYILILYPYSLFLSSILILYSYLLFLPSIFILYPYPASLSLSLSYILIHPNTCQPSKARRSSIVVPNHGKHTLHSSHSFGREQRSEKTLGGQNRKKKKIKTRKKRKLINGQRAFKQQTRADPNCREFNFQGNSVWKPETDCPPGYRSLGPWLGGWVGPGL